MCVCVKIPLCNYHVYLPRLRAGRSHCRDTFIGTARQRSKRWPPPAGGAGARRRERFFTCLALTAEGVLEGSPSLFTAVRSDQRGYGVTRRWRRLRLNFKKKSDGAPDADYCRCILGCLRLCKKKKKKGEKTHKTQSRSNFSWRVSQ